MAKPEQTDGHNHELLETEDRTTVIGEIAREVVASAELQDRIEKFLAALQLTRQNTERTSDTNAEVLSGEQVNFWRVPYIGITSEGTLVCAMTDQWGGYHKRIVKSTWPTGLMDDAPLMAPIVYGGSNIGDDELRIDFVTKDNQNPYADSFRKPGGGPVEQRDYLKVYERDGEVRADLHDGLSGEDTSCYSLEEVLRATETLCGDQEKLYRLGRLVLGHASQPEYAAAA